jgi:predicted nucleic acid-binding protein
MRSFIDTNVLVYLVDSRDARKQGVAEEIVEGALSERLDCRISVQTLTEFSNVCLKKLGTGKATISAFLDCFDDLPLVRTDAQTVKTALEIKARYGIQFYDAMMIAAAIESGCDEILSEDLNEGQCYGGVVAHNPFA